MRIQVCQAFRVLGSFLEVRLVLNSQPACKAVPERDVADISAGKGGLTRAGAWRCCQGWWISFIIEREELKEEQNQDTQEGDGDDDGTCQEAGAGVPGDECFSMQLMLPMTE